MTLLLKFIFKKSQFMKYNLKLSNYFYLLLCLCNTISAKDINPSYCNSIPLQKNGWDEVGAKATMTSIPNDCQKIWCAYALDATWSSWSETPITFTPGDPTVTTPKIIPSGSYWNPSASSWPGGAASYKKPGFVAFCLWSKFNTDFRNQDCTIQISPSNFDCSFGTCQLAIPLYCDNFRACLFEDKKTISMTGLNNYTSNNWFAYSDDGWASYADITPTLNPRQDAVTIDFSQITYDAGPKKGSNVEIPLTGQLIMMADSYGLGKCTADNNGGNNKNGIDMTTVLICSKPGINDINVVTTNSLSISPNPATPSETITIKGEYALDSKVSITSVSGAMVGSVIPAVSADAMTVSLSGLNLQAGIYFIRIESGEKVFSGKLCVK